jgi:DNA-binding NarL/FixJ family response regulator
MTIRVLIADDQMMVREGFSVLLNAMPDIEVVGEAVNGRQAVDRVRELAPDVVLMDIRMPELNGIEATREIVAADGSAKVLVLTTFDLDEYAFAALKAGASGFLLKNARPEELLAAIRAVAAGEAVLSPRITRRLLDGFVSRIPDGTPSGGDPAERLSPLTPREREVLVQVARGRSNAEIAAALFLAEATVKTHFGRILQKLDLRDRAQAVALAYETRLVAPP